MLSRNAEFSLAFFAVECDCHRFAVGFDLLILAKPEYKRTRNGIQRNGGGNPRYHCSFRSSEPVLPFGEYLPQAVELVFEPRIGGHDRIADVTLRSTNCVQLLAAERPSGL